MSLETLVLIWIFLEQTCWAISMIRSDNCLLEAMLMFLECLEEAEPRGGKKTMYAFREKCLKKMMINQRTLTLFPQEIQTSTCRSTSAWKVLTIMSVQTLLQMMGLLRP